jgi:two-component system, chemotaxis family, protein-glutamate methylesterase/glutaminase
VAHHDVIVVGASSGGVEALTKVLGSLPADLAAAVFVVLHVNPEAPSYLPSILNRAGRLPAAHAVDQEPIRRGRVYVAPPGLQMYVHRGRIAVRRAPVENLHRPAIDPLFRTAAHHYGPRVIAIVLTGALDDGAAGLVAVKRAGGVAIIQDPDDAAFPAMPMNALERVAPDFCVPVDQIGQLVIELVATGAPAGRGAGGHSDPLPHEVALETIDEAPSPDDATPSEKLGVASGITCPDCSGALWEIDEGTSIRYRCRIGHAYSQETIARAQEASVERAMWTALRAVEERVALLRKLADQAERRGHAGVAGVFRERAQAVEQDAGTIHGLITASRAMDPVGHSST